MPNNTDTNRRLLAARYRHAARTSSNAVNYGAPKTTGSSDKRDFRTFMLGPENPTYQEAGIGSGIRALVKLATKSKYPKRAPKGASIDEKMQYTADRAKALKAARDKAKAGEQAKKDKRLAKYNAKRAKAFDRAAGRKSKAEQRLRDKQSDARWQAQERADAEFNALKQMRQRQGRTR